MNTPYVFRQCTKCKQWLIASKNNFSKHKKSKWGLNSICKKCAKKRGKEYYESQPMNHVILKRLQDEVIKKYGAFLVGETSNVTPEIGNIFLKNGELDMFFEFEHSFCDENKLLPILKKKFKPKNLIKPIFKWQESVPWLGVYLENHDQRRSVSRYGSDKYYKESAKALSVFLLSLKGTIFIYEGEEIGMTDYKNYSYEDLNDCASISTINTAMRLLHLSIYLSSYSLNCYLFLNILHVVLDRTTEIIP